MEQEALGSMALFLKMSNVEVIMMEGGSAEAGHNLFPIWRCAACILLEG